MAPSEAEQLEAWLGWRDRRAHALALLALLLVVPVPAALMESGGAWVGSAFLGALVIHELGHRLFRGRGARPRLHLATLFGARSSHRGEGSPAAIFREHGASALLGLAAAAVLLLVAPVIYWFYGLDWLEWLGIALVWTSWLSLLPLPACDGGQLLDRVFFPRAPLRSWTIQLVVVVLLTLGSLMVMVILLALAVPAVVMMARSRQVARVRAQALALGLSPVSAAAALEAVAAAGFGELSFARRRRLAAALLEGPAGLAPAPLTALALGVVYLGGLAAGPALMVSALVGR